ncbi:MAG: HVA1 family protein [Chitinophagaceae bacterium]
MKDIKIGDKVRWDSEAGEVSGTVIGIKTKPFDVNGYTHHADTDNPQYEIKSSISDHIAYHKPEALSVIEKFERGTLLQKAKDGKVGGYLVGRKHSECNDEGDCGIKAVVDEKKPIEVQSDEAIITAKAVNDKTLHTFDGKKLNNKQILSTINVSGGGVAFAGNKNDKENFETGGRIENDTRAPLSQNEIYNLNFLRGDKSKKIYISDRNKINGIIHNGLGYATNYKGIKQLHLTREGIGFVRGLPLRLFDVKKFAAGGVIEEDTVKEINVDKTRYFKGFYFKYPSQFKLNLSIFEYLDLTTDRDKKDFDAEEKTFLSYFTGFGGMSKKYGEEIEAAGSEQELNSFFKKGLQKSFLTEFYTPSNVSEAMWRLAYKYGYKDYQKVLEPSCGIGEFIRYVKNKSRVTANELNYYSYRIAQILYPEANIYNIAFESNFIYKNSSIREETEILSKYDLVIGNPPYGGRPGSIYFGMGEGYYTKAANWIDYFIFRGLDLLEKDGLLIYVVGTSNSIGGQLFLESANSNIKEKIAAKSTLEDAYILPNKIFPNTDIVSEIIVLRKK